MKSNEAIVSQAVRSSSGKAFSHAWLDMRASPVAVSAVVKVNPLAMEFAAGAAKKHPLVFEAMIDGHYSFIGEKNRTRQHVIKELDKALPGRRWKQIDEYISWLTFVAIFVMTGLFFRGLSYFVERTSSAFRLLVTFGCGFAWIVGHLAVIIQSTIWIPLRYLLKREVALALRDTPCD